MPTFVPTYNRVCAYGPCNTTFPAEHKRRYCTRDHKERARRQRRANPERPLTELGYARGVGAGVHAKPDFPEATARPLAAKKSGVQGVSGWGLSIDARARRAG